MLKNIETWFRLNQANYQDIIVCGLIMVSAIIVAIGLLKPLIFNKIKNKNLRGSVIALTNVVACFLTVFVYFLINGIGFDFYVLAATSLSCLSIIVYHLYEYTRLRDLIGLIGNIALRKVAKFSIFALTEEDVEAVKAEAKKVGQELKIETKNKLKKVDVKVDKDLAKL
jgi:hypothetical protein